MSIEYQYTQNFVDSLHGIIWVIGAVVGSFTAQFWYTFLTRRNTIFVNMLFQVIASVLMIIPLEIYHGYDQGEPSPTSIRNALQMKDVAITLFYISRFLSGWAAGMSCVATTIYLIEISPRKMRGKVVTYHQLFIVIGILVGQIVSFPWLLGQHNKWHWGMAWVGIFPLVGCFLIWKLPESPRWFVQERMRAEALQSLQTLRKTNEVHAELTEIEREEATVNMEDLSLIRLFTSSRFRWPLLTSVILSAAAQFSGINSVSIVHDEN
ncbi:unnamed protein product [Rotaria sp. Silwood1]|nr:unnamed protein product [Rotaria sp. Silwood1]CAF1325447.1 unnamed protein product [Rotaria sp. Silwood1]CAF3519471.1 unnamed protein product [Rotaria sp. Silwood1]CAF3544975.1 unnamed protein product [Rotaria sp. Silwood1]CAF3550498.1 unnamed protein product [Rotaria sp. Silwood1]